MAPTILRVLLVTMAVAMATVSAASRDEYCRLCKDHTMCLYSGVSSACGRPLARQVTSDADKQLIVARHNELRRKVAQGQENQGQPGPQPPAAEMKTLVWDNELAAVAQRWLDQCIWPHDKCRNVQRFSVGQNMYKTMSTSTDTTPGWMAAVNGWYDEVKFQNKNDINPFKYNDKTGHYTQVVWGKTSTIGCGYIVYYDSSQPKYPYTKVYGCDYGPAGNVVGPGSKAY